MIGIEHVCVICAFIFGYWYRGERDKIQLRINGQRDKLRALSGKLARRRLTGEAIEAKMERVALTEGERAQSFYDDDLTQCIYDAARKAGVMDEPTPDPRFAVAQGETWKSNAQTVTTTT